LSRTGFDLDPSNFYAKDEYNNVYAVVKLPKVGTTETGYGATTVTPEPATMLLMAFGSGVM
jgi:hypothetical protein